MTDTMDFAQWARNWEAMSRQAMSTFPGGKTPAWNPQDGMQRQWNEGMTQWARQFGSGAPQSDAIERVMAGAQGYLGMLQSMAAAAGGHASGDPLSWFDAMKGSAGFSAAAPSWFNNPITEAMRSFARSGAQGFEQMMERFASAASPMFNDAKGMLSMPAFGHLREHQENAQKSAKALIEYQEQMARYNRLMLKVSEHAFARFQLKLAEREEPGRQIDSVRGVYDLWIDAAEEAYAEVALSEEFRDVYGALVNAQMHVREHVQREVERISTDLGIPTRSEIDTIGERLQALRREFRDEREAGIDFGALTAEVTALRGELAAMKSTIALKPVPVSNVVAFVRPVPKADVAIAAAPVRVSRKRKSAVQAAAKAGKLKTIASKAKHAAKSSPPVVKIKPKVASTDAPASFAASIARFARENRSEPGSKFGRAIKSKSGKR